MKKIVLVLGFFYIPFLGMCQSIEKSSVDSGGASVTQGNIQVLYTIGEVHVREVTVGNITISEGFINPSTFANIKAQGNATDIVYGALSPSLTNDTDFGIITINTATSKTYTIQNTGTATLTISSIVSSGTDTSDFVVGDITLPAIIAAGANSTFTLTLTATSIGKKTATVTINNNDSNKGTYTFAVKAIGRNGATWTGAVSSVWNVVGNWNNNVVPIANYNVTIPNVARTPDIKSAVQMTNLTIEASASFNISPSGSVIVEGDLNANEFITMESDATNSSTLFVKGTSTGSVMYKRGGLLANKWSIVSAPVQGQSIKDFAENAQNGIRTNTSVTPNRYAIGYYDDSRATGTKWVFYTATDLAGDALTFEKGKSYTISRATNGSVTFTGTLETVDVVQSVTGSKWNAVGNPYTTFLPLNENTGNNFINDNISKFNPANVGIYIWDTMQSKYVGKSLVSDQSSFAPGQGFFMKTNTGNSHVIFKESARKIQPISGGGFNKTRVNVTPSIQLKVASNGVILDTNIKYFENATIGLDPGYDLENFGRGVFDIYTRLLDDQITKNFTIQSLPNRDYESMIIPIGVVSKSGKNLRFSVITSHLPEGIEVFIEDKKLNVLTELDLNTSYDVTTTEKLDGVGRFYLHTKQKALSVDDLQMKDVEIYTKEGNILIVNGIFNGAFTVKLYTVLGALICDKTSKGNGKNSIRLSNVSKGIYIVKVFSEFGNKSKKIIIN